MKESKESIQENKVYNVGFFLKNDIEKEHKDRYKKHLYSLSDKEGFTYSLLGESKASHTEAIALSIYDAQSDRYKNVVIADGKNYIFSSSDDGENFIVEIIPQSVVDKNGLAHFSEDFFKGYPYKISDSTKELKKVYLKNEHQAIKVAALLAMMGVGAFLYYQNVINKPKVVKMPPKPTVAPVSLVEKSEAKRFINLEILEDILSEVKASASLDSNETDSWKNTRISLLRIEKIKEGRAENPRYNKARNIWVYKDPSNKRGHISCTLSKGYQKLYADLDYDKRGKDIFYKEKSEKYKKYFDTTVSKRPSKAVTTDCLRDAFKLGTIQERGKGYIQYKFKPELKDIRALKVLRSMQNILKECPVYFSSFNLRDTSKSGEFFMYYDFVREGKK